MHQCLTIGRDTWCVRYSLAALLNTGATGYQEVLHTKRTAFRSDLTDFNVHEFALKMVDCGPKECQ